MWLEELGRGIRPIGPILLNGIRPTWRDDQQSMTMWIGRIVEGLLEFSNEVVIIGRVSCSYPP
jgi:hypothetical protein